MVNQLALARRLRPLSFPSVVGQEVTLQALSNALKTGRLHHAYLFTGTRGVGKTTLARIFAKCLNCEQGTSNQPCGTCDTCRSIDEGRCVDVIEVDAASRTKVEDTRELLDNVQYMPASARFKIYLIDEVHMLSTHSFNALLKTLEEPPAHVKFLLATTDPQKLPVTVLSRCLQFHLHRLPFTQIVNYLQQVLTAESLTFEMAALEAIARGSEGSLRDALSLLEQAIAYSDGNLTFTSVRMMLGLTEPEKLLALLEAVVLGQAAEMLQEINALASVVLDFSSVLSEFLTLLRHVSILQEAPNALEESVAHREALMRFAQMIAPEELQLYYQIGVLGQKELPLAPTLRIGFEMVMLRMLAFQPCKIAKIPVTQNVHNASVGSTNHTPVTSVPLSSPMTSLKEESPQKTTSRVEVSKSTPAPMNSIAVHKPEPLVDINLNKNTVPAIPAPASSSLEEQPQDLLAAINWPSLVPKLELTGITRQIAQHCTLEEHNFDSIHLRLEESQRPLLQKRQEETLKQALTQYFGKALRLKISVGKIPEGVKTPAGHQQQQQETAFQQACDILEKDPKLNHLINLFDAKVEKVEVEKH